MTETTVTGTIVGYWVQPSCNGRDLPLIAQDVLGAAETLNSFASLGAHIRSDALGFTITHVVDGNLWVWELETHVR